MSLEREEGYGCLGWESLLSCNPDFNPSPIWTRLMNTFDEQFAKTSLRIIQRIAQKAIPSFGSNDQWSKLFLWFVSTGHERRSPTPRRPIPS
jgi:hypothetical protein